MRPTQTACRGRLKLPTDNVDMPVDNTSENSAKPLSSPFVGSAEISGNLMQTYWSLLSHAHRLLAPQLATRSSIISVMKHLFTLRLQLPDDNWDHDDLARRLDAANCGDAVICIGRPGHIALEFTREVGSMDEAIESARADVTTAIPTALLID